MRKQRDAKTTLRDKLWMWGHVEGSHNGPTWKLPGQSRMTPTEAAVYLGIPNLVMVAYGNKPEPPFDQYALPFRALDRVVWSVIGDSSTTRNDKVKDVDAVLDLTRTLPNLSGAIMDDFFVDRGGGAYGGRCSIDELASLRKRLHESPNKVDLWCVFYDGQLDWPVLEYLREVDIVNFWTWKASDLHSLERNFARLEALMPKARKVLGCYMYDYGARQVMPVELMQRQCEVGVEWLRTGRIEGMVFLASCICDLGLDAVEWTRDWVAREGDRSITG